MKGQNDECIPLSSSMVFMSKKGFNKVLNVITLDRKDTQYFHLSPHNRSLFSLQTI
jgi:hypothetical protein